MQRDSASEPEIAAFVRRCMFTYSINSWPFQCYIQTYTINIKMEKPHVSDNLISHLIKHDNLSTQVDRRALALGISTFCRHPSVGFTPGLRSMDTRSPRPDWFYQLQSIRESLLTSDSSKNSLGHIFSSNKLSCLRDYCKSTRDLNHRPNLAPSLQWHEE